MDASEAEEKGLLHDIITYIMNILMKRTLVSFGAGRSSINRRIVRSAYRTGVAPAYRDSDYGFRPSRTYP